MRVTRYNIWQWPVYREAFAPARLLSVGKKALALALLFMTLPTIALGATVFQDFEDTDSLSANFTEASNSSGSVNWSATGGINDSGRVAIGTSTSVDFIYTTKQKFSLDDNGVLTISALFHSQFNTGYGSLGITTAATSNASGSQGSPSESSFGMSFHGGGGSWMNNNSLSNLSWQEELDADESDAEWYLFKLQITDKGNDDFDLEFWIYDVDQTTGVQGTLKTNHTTTVTNPEVKAASDLYVFFGAETASFASQGSRMVGLDNLTIETGNYAADFAANSGYGQFDGTADDIFDVGDGGSEVSVSIASWINLDTIGPVNGTNVRHEIFAFHTPGQSQSSYRKYTLYVLNDKLWLAVGDGSAYARCSHSATLAASTDYHVVGTYNASTNSFTLWVNGDGVTLSSPNTSDCSQSTWDIQINTAASDIPLVGAYKSSTSITQRMDGRVDELAVWNTALSDTDVQSIYQDGHGVANVKSVLPTNLLAYWNFNEAAGTTVYDQSGNSVDMSLTGTTAFVGSSWDRTATASFSPVNGATGVSASASLSLTFSDGVRKSDNSALESGDLSSYIVLRDTNSSGTAIAFTGSINTDKDTITVSPTSSFTSNQTVYFAFASGLERSDNPITPSSSTFTVETVADTTAPTISSVSLGAANDALTVTFSEDVYNTNGGSGDLEASDFALSISGGTATVTATPTSITKTSQSVWVLGVNTSGTADGSETLSVVPSGAAAIYDAAGNAASTAQSNNTASLTAADTTPPTLDVGPSVGSVTSSGFTPSASINEAGKIYFVVVADGATAPSPAQVKAGQDATGSAALASASATVPSSPFTASFSAITSLSASTAYDVYFIAEDDESAPNVQTSVSKVDATTSAPAPTVPGAPTNVTAVAGDGEATVSWSAPASNGGAEITSYTATTNPSCTTSTTSCTVTGLTNGTAYTFTVTATNAAGTSAASARSNSVTPTASSVTPATPVPVLSLWALWIFSGLLGLLGLRRLSQ